MTKALAIALMVIAPLAWGLLVEYLFELRRRRHAPPSGGADDGKAEEAESLVQ